MILKNIKVHMTLFWNNIHLTSLNPPPLIEMPVRSQETQRSLVLEVSTLPLSTLFLMFRQSVVFCFSVYQVRSKSKDVNAK
jgi:hypothetical protein